jgi:uncharacterized protein (DUF1501 family)
MNRPLEHHVDVAMDCGCVRHRRDILRGATSVGAAASMLSWTDLVSGAAGQLRSSGRACILLWMQGGPSQYETFTPIAPHPNAGETKAISTKVPGIQIAENLPKVAEMMDDLAIIRSVNSREGSHPRASFLLHTGYLPTAAIKHPALGSIAAQQLGDRESELPNFVRVGRGIRNAANGGLLGSQYNALELPVPGSPPTNAAPATTTVRFERRLELLDRLESDFARRAGEEAIADHRRLYEQTARMVTSPQMEAFDLERETQAMRDAYGQTPFGAGCLLARRLVEAGVTFVEVGAGNWDTHADNFERSKQLTAEIDQPMAQLIRDLKQRGMLEKTLVIWMGEFGRTPRINPRAGRDHYPRAFNVALAGGGIQGGRVIGKVDPSGSEVAERPVSVQDLFQTFCKSLRIDAEVENMSPAGRPIRVVDGGEPVLELFS